MPRPFRTFLLLLSATWALVSFARLQPLQFSTEPLPWLLYALPAALTLALCLCAPESWSSVAWFVASATTLGAVGVLSWLPIGLSFLGAVPSAVGGPVVTLLLAATLFWFASQPADCFAPWTTHSAFAALTFVSPFSSITTPPTPFFPSAWKPHSPTDLTALSSKREVMAARLALGYGPNSSARLTSLYPASYGVEVSARSRASLPSQRPNSLSPPTAVSLSHNSPAPIPISVRCRA